MVSTRKKSYTATNKTLGPDHSLPQTFETLIAAIRAPEGREPSLLNSLYYELCCLSLNSQLCYFSDKAASNYLDMKFEQFGFKVTCKDIRDLSNIMFKELCERFEHLFSALRDVFANQAHGQSGLCSDMWTTAEELVMLLRCCMVILTLLMSDQKLLSEKSQVLISILGGLCSPDLIGGREKHGIRFKKPVSVEYAYTNNACYTSVAEEFVASLSFLEPSSTCLPFVCAMLEVFADELLAHRPLREYLMLIDSVSSASEVLFMYHPSHGDVGSVLEVISAHFLISVSDEQAVENFLNRLVWQHINNYRVPELSLIAAVSLLLNPIMLSAPKIFQAHLISLVSEAIGIGMASRNIRPDLRQMDCYLSAFDRSIILYTRYISSLQMDGHPAGANDSVVKPSMSGRSFQLSFESYIKPLTRNKINDLITKLEKSWKAHKCYTHFRTKSDLLSAAITYMKESQDVLDNTCRDEILSILNCIILRASGDANDTSLNSKGDMNPQDIYLLASILKLMSSSLLQALWCVRHGGNLDCVKSLKDCSSCMEYDFIVGIMGCFRQRDASLPIQKFLVAVLENHPMRHKESELMLLHLSGLLSFCFASGLDFLVKGCIYTMMTLMNLLILEEANLDALRSLLNSGSESFSSGLSPDKVGETVKDQKCVQIVAYKKCSQIVASEFQKIQMLHLSTDSASSDRTRIQDEQAETLANALSLDSVDRGVDVIEEESCDGKIFLKCVLEGPEKLPDSDDLADFIECKRGKDYSSWVKNRQRFRKWKYEKMAILRWQKKKKTWKYMRENKM